MATEPRGPFKGPRGPFKRTPGSFKGPRGPLKGPRGPFQGPRGPVAILAQAFGNLLFARVRYGSPTVSGHVVRCLICSRSACWSCTYFPTAEWALRVCRVVARPTRSRCIAPRLRNFDGLKGMHGILRRTRSLICDLSRSRPHSLLR